MPRAKAQVRSQGTISNKDTSETLKEFGGTSRIFNTHLMASPGRPHAKVGYAAFMRRAVDFSSLQIGGEAWVEVVCDQDDEMIQFAQNIVVELAKNAVEEREAEFQQALDEYMMEKRR